VVAGDAGDVTVLEQLGKIPTNVGISQTFSGKIKILHPLNDPASCGYEQT